MKCHRHLFLIVTLILSMLFSSMNASASFIDPDTPVGPEIPEEYVHLKSIISNISVSRGVATVSSQGIVGSGSTDSVYVTIKLQRMANNTWTTLHTWSGSGTGHCAVSGSWNVVSGYTYRNFTTVTVYTASGSYVETVYKTSSQYY